jgi:hypothetical protein
MSAFQLKITSKALRYCLLLTSTLIGCGGGGGDDRDSLPQLCRSYCSFSCSKASACGLFPASQVSSCDDSCVQTAASNGATSESCDQRGQRIAQASCSELRAMLGLRSLEDNAELKAKRVEDQEAIAAHSGAELATSAAE